MYTNKIAAGSPFPAVTAVDLKDNKLDISKIQGKADWKMVLVYRGRHCPLCTRYLNELAEYTEKLEELGVEIVAVSGDSKAQLREHMSRLTINFPIYHGLTLEQMKELGLYISHPRSEQETDHPFAEPGLFVINESGGVQVVDISNNPFVRPQLEALVNGLEWIRNNTYPIRGTYSYE